MEQTQAPQQSETAPQGATPAASKPRRRGCLVATLVGLVLLVILWLLLRPGVFTVQPIGALPEGVTFIYHSRGPQMSFFSSPDGLCLEMQSSVSLLCRGAALSAASDLTDRILIRLPYSHWAYLQSTGGMDFAE